MAFALATGGDILSAKLGGCIARRGAGKAISETLGTRPLVAALSHGISLRQIDREVAGSGCASAVAGDGTGPSGNGPAASVGGGHRGPGRCGPADRGKNRREHSAAFAAD